MGNSMSTKSPCKIAIPLYLWPGYGAMPCAWDRILATPAANPIVVVNPDSGPGDKAFKLFSDAVSKCQAVGIKVLGYVRTEYSKRDLSLVAQDLQRYHSWYNVDGFFIDEMYHWDEAQLAYYASAKAAAAEALDKQPLLVLNPGCSSFPEAYLPLADIFVTYEGAAVDYTAFVPAPFMAKHPSSKFWHMVYSARAASSPAVLQHFKQQNASWLYLTDLDLDNPYKDLPADDIWQQQLQVTEA